MASDSFKSDSEAMASIVKCGTQLEMMSYLVKPLTERTAISAADRGILQMTCNKLDEIKQCLKECEDRFRRTTTEETQQPRLSLQDAVENRAADL